MIWMPYAFAIYGTSREGGGIFPQQQALLWHIQHVDTPRLFDSMTDRSLRIDANGQYHIAYGKNFLFYTWSQGAPEIVDGSGGVGRYASLALDNDGNPHISYWGYTTLKYARWTGSRWDVQTVDTGNVGHYTSIALDSAGNPHISYHAYVNGYLKYARWTGSRWDIQTVDWSGDVGGYISLALDNAGNPHISYFYEWYDDLKYARWTGSGWVIQTVDSSGSVGMYTSIALDSAGNPPY
jgi:hypothetical protein